MYRKFLPQTDMLAVNWIIRVAVIVAFIATIVVALSMVRHGTPVSGGGVIWIKR
jgi:hypothetical protein